LSIEQSTSSPTATDERVDIVATALRKAFRTNAFNPWNGIARQAVQALDEQYGDRDLDTLDERARLDEYIRGHELMMRYKQEIWDDGYKQGRRDAADAVRSALRVSDPKSASLHSTLIAAADGSVA